MVSESNENRFQNQNNQTKKPMRKEITKTIEQIRKKKAKLIQELESLEANERILVKLRKEMKSEIEKRRVNKVPPGKRKLIPYRRNEAYD